jgi:hypothetical protein
MDVIEAECPACHATNRLPAETIGKYPTCPNCGVRFYVVVPQFPEPQGGPVLARPSTFVPPKKVTTQGDRRQAMLTWMIVALLVLGLLNLAGIALLLIMFRQTLH